MSMDEILKNIYADADAAFPADEVAAGGGGEPAMTLEDFLTKAGAVREEEVRAVAPFVVEAETASFHNNNNSNSNGRGVVVGRGKRRAAAAEEVVVDKATQQKQRRMIKNRESAARSRERKQAYTVELESLVTQLEEENARLLREEAEQTKERFKQLMENLIPVVERKRPPRVLRRVNSM